MQGYYILGAVRKRNSVIGYLKSYLYKGQTRMSCNEYR